VQRRARALLGATVLVAAALVVGVADPLATTPSRDPVALDAPPADAARDALRQARTGDYTLRVAFRAPNGSERVVTVARVESSERELLSESAGDRPEYLTYVNEHVGWRGPPGDLERGAGDFAAHLPFPHLGAIDAGDVTRSVTDERLVLRVTDDETALALTGYDPEVGGNATVTVVVDRSSRTLVRTTFVRRWRADNETEYEGYTYRFSEWGETEVTRPPGAGYSLPEFLRDAVS
jgi:hypothetical protein